MHLYLSLYLVLLKQYLILIYPHLDEIYRYSKFQIFKHCLSSVAHNATLTANKVL